MSKPYSTDLRLRVISVYKEGGKTQKEVAKIFALSESSVKRYIRLDRENKSIASQPWGGGRPGLVDEKGYQLITEAIEKNPAITLAELSVIYQKRRKKKLGSSVLSRACQKLKLTRKKLSIYAAERDREDIKKKAGRLSKRNK